MTPAELARYSRQLVLPEVGLEGQERLKTSRVLVVGVGGLGSPVATYLAAAGVGTLGLVDFDSVDETNLHRQVLYGTSDVGRPKLEAACERLRDLNPHINLLAHAFALEADRALDLMADFDVVVDGTDNFATRYLVNDACVLLRKPNVFGSIMRFEGQASVFAMPGGPCYRCLHPEPPPPGSIPSCAEGGVLGVLPAIIGSLQAAETLKILLGIGEPLIGRFLIFDALRASFRQITLRRDPECPVCGDAPTIRSLRDYDIACHVAPAISQTVDHVAAGPAVSLEVPEMTVEALKRRLDDGHPPVVLDVREAYERAICAIPGSTHIPIGELSQRTSELDPNEELVVYCRSGGRSGQAVAWLRTAGFTSASSLAGGVLAWVGRIDPSQPSY